jgi:ABC-type cobalamin transport system ATPase subunit
VGYEAAALALDDGLRAAADIGGDEWQRCAIAAHAAATQYPHAPWLMLVTTVDYRSLLLYEA